MLSGYQVVERHVGLLCSASSSRSCRETGPDLEPALFPQLFPIPDPGRHLVRQPESELMREHAHLPAMVGFVRKHVAQHFQANRPRRSPAVSAKLLDAAPATAERFSEHLRAASGALGQSRTGLLRRAVRAVELSWNLQVRSGKPDPLGADVVHVREDRRNGADLARRLGSPGRRVKMFDEHLVHAIVGGKDLDCGSTELSVNLPLTSGRGSLLFDLAFHAVVLPLLLHAFHYLNGGIASPFPVEPEQPAGLLTSRWSRRAGCPW